MAKNHSVKMTLGVALLLAGGALLVSSPEARAENEAKAPKSIRLGVDPDQYLRNRHKRVHRARHQANLRAGTPPATMRPAGYQESPSASGGTKNLDSLNIPKEYAGAPGFNEFSHLSEGEKAQAEEIMQFLKAYQAQ